MILDKHGRFETLVEVDLPPARRGWRIARHQLTVGEDTFDTSSVVLLPPPEARRAVVVILPFDATFAKRASVELARWRHAGQLSATLQEIGKGQAVYYVAAVPRSANMRPAELALATTALGWPAGHFILLPVKREDARAHIAAALDNLRALFFDHLDLTIVNAEDALQGNLCELAVPLLERASVIRVIERDEPTPKFCQAAQHIRPTRAGLLPRHPVVFCHGMLAFSMIKMRIPEDTNCFAPLRGFLRERGFRVFYPQVPPTSGVVERAASLREQILRWTEEPVNLIAHSMGGLDARYMISRLGMAERVRTLTTISTPHRGTYLADWFVANFRQRVPLLRAFEALGVNVDGFRDCLPQTCQDFNAGTPDHPAVRYFSYGGEVPSWRLSPALRRAWILLSPIEGPNDGMVSLASSRWGDYLGTIHADHFAQTPDAVFVRDGEDFDSPAFYTRLVEDLARRGY